MKELSADPAARDSVPRLGREERHDTAPAAYDRLTETKRLHAHHEPLPPQTSDSQPTLAEYLADVAGYLDECTPAFQRWAQARLPAPAG